MSRRELARKGESRRVDRVWWCCWRCCCWRAVAVAKHRKLEMPTPPLATISTSRPPQRSTTSRLLFAPTMAGFGQFRSLESAEISDGFKSFSLSSMTTRCEPERVRFLSPSLRSRVLFIDVCRQRGQSGMACSSLPNDTTPDEFAILISCSAAKEREKCMGKSMICTWPGVLSLILANPCCCRTRAGIGTLLR